MDGEDSLDYSWEVWPQPSFDKHPYLFSLLKAQNMLPRILEEERMLKAKPSPLLDRGNQIDPL
jgi:hypothetical protein